MSQSQTRQDLKLTDRKRLDIIEAAIEEFQSNGYGAATMDKIARRAGVSKRTVYNHFPSKDDLFEGVVLKLWEVIQQQIRFPYSKDVPIREQLLDIARISTEICCQENNFALARVILAECVRSPELGKRALSDFVNSHTHLTTWIEQAAADGRLRVEHPVMAARQFDALLDAFAFWPQVLANRPLLEGAEREMVMNSVVDMFLCHYGAR